MKRVERVKRVRAGAQPAARESTTIATLARTLIRTTAPPPC